MNEWIPIAERKPNPQGQGVLVFGRVWFDTNVVDSVLSFCEPEETCIPFFETGYYFKDDEEEESWQLACNDESDITHWMPLPEMPQ